MAIYNIWYQLRKEFYTFEMANPFAGHLVVFIGANQHHAYFARHGPKDDWFRVPLGLLSPQFDDDFVGLEVEASVVLKDGVVETFDHCPLSSVQIEMPTSYADEE